MNMSDFMNEPVSDDEVDFLPLLPEEEGSDSKKLSIPDVLPLLPLRNTVLFPGVVLPITVGRDKSILAVKEAYKQNKLIGVVGQIDANIEEPEFKDIFRIGTIAQILRMIKMANTMSFQNGRRQRHGLYAGWHRSSHQRQPTDRTGWHDDHKHRAK